jgi:hypothetical protein
MFRDMNTGATKMRRFEHHTTTWTSSNSVFLDGGENNTAHTNVHAYNNSAVLTSHPADGSLPHSTFLRTAIRASHTAEITRTHRHCLYLEAPLDELGEVRLQQVLLHDLQQRLAGGRVQQPSAHLHALLQQAPTGGHQINAPLTGPAVHNGVASWKAQQQQREQPFCRAAADRITDKVTTEKYAAAPAAVTHTNKSAHPNITVSAADTTALRTTHTHTSPKAHSPAGGGPLMPGTAPCRTPRPAEPPPRRNTAQSPAAARTRTACTCAAQHIRSWRHAARKEGDQSTGKTEYDMHKQHGCQTLTR